MFQSSIKKITTRLVIVSMVLCAGLWFAGCGQKEEEQKEEDPLNVSGGEVTKGGDGDNTSVTEANLDDFVSAFLSALNSERFPNYNAPRGKRDERPDEYRKGKEVYQRTYKLNGDSSGYVEITEEDGEISDDDEYENYTVKFFNFSNTNKLFLGGAVGNVGKWEKDKNGIETETDKYNGSINFKGAFEGKVVFDNFSEVLKYKSIYGEDRIWLGDDTISCTKSGKFYVESKGKQIILPDSLIWGFFWPNSGKDRDFGDGKITLARPAIPAAPSGNLSDHAGNNAVVNADNVSVFFEAFMEEFYNNYNYPRAANEATETFEKLRHGKVSGYSLEKGDGKGQSNNSGIYSVGTQTVKYDNYSNEGRLYFGGGFGELYVAFSKHTSNSYTSKDTTTINGKVKFNGEFKGELDFQNFKFERKDEGFDRIEYKLVSGSVKIASFDVTDSYIKYVLKRGYEPEPILPPGPTPPGPTPGGGVSLLTGDWEESWVDITWGGGEISGYDFDAKGGTVYWDAKVPQEDPSNDVYPGAMMAVYFESAGKLKTSTKITLKYSSSSHLRLILLMEEGSITEDLFDAQYFAALDAANSPRTITLDLSKSGGKWKDEEEEGNWPNMSGNHFRQPSWAGSQQTFNLNVSKIVGFAFSIPSDEYGENSTDVEITKLELTDSNL